LKPDNFAFGYGDPKRNSGKYDAASKRLKQVQGQIDRLALAIRESDVPVQELMVQLKPLHLERESLTQQVKRLEADANVVSFHPNIAKTFVANVRELLRGMRQTETDPKARAGLRKLLDSIVVHKTERRQPYEITPYTRLSTLMGVDAPEATEEPAAFEGVAIATESRQPSASSQ